MTRAWLPCLLASVLLACGGSASEEDARAQADSRLHYSAPDPSESRPIPQGFTHRPPPDTPGLPAPPPPLLTPEEERAALAAADRAGDDARERAQEEILELVERFERSDGAVEDRDRLREAVLDRLRAGLLPHLSADAIFSRYLFPNEASADAAFRQRLVVLTGTAAPHSMLDLADGFKVFDRSPYVHEPVLLATVHEMSFVRCLLARPKAQKLRDWQEVHLVGVVSGKERTDVVLRRCVVL